MNEPGYGAPGGPAQPNGEWNIEEQLRAQAVSNLRRRAAFRVHLLVYCLVNLLLVATWVAVGVATDVWFPWWVFPLFGWGIGLGVHAYTTYRGFELSESRIRNEINRIAGS